LVVAGTLTLIADRAWLDKTAAQENGSENPLRFLLSFGLACVCVFSYWTYGFNAIFWKTSIFTSTMMVVAYVDQRTSKVPNVLTLPLLALGLLQSTLTAPGLVSSLVGALIVGGGLLFIAVLTKAIGFGAVKLQMAIGAWLGWELALAALLMTVVGMAAATCVAATSHKRMSQTFPLATYIAISGVLASPLRDLLSGWMMS